MKPGIGDKIIVILLSLWFLNKFLGGTILVALISLIIAYKLYTWNIKQTTWKKLGVPGPPPVPIFGCFFELLKLGFHGLDTKYTKLYGKTFGLYFFTGPDIVTSDLELVKSILVKDFRHFTNRREFEEFIPNDDALILKGVSILRDDEWKSVRNTITPAFTSGKLKNMLPVMMQSVETFEEILAEHEKQDKAFDMKHIVGNCALELIAAIAFATKIDCQRNPDDKFHIHAEKVFKFSFKDPLTVISALFPYSIQYVKKVTGPLGLDLIDLFFRNNLTHIIKERRKRPLTEKPDFLQLLLNAADNEINQNTKSDSLKLESDKLSDGAILVNEDTSNNKNEPIKRWPMTDDLIIAQCFLFLVAGYETTSTTLTLASYFLALYPDIQEKCYEEIASNTENNTVSYNDIQNKFPYLDAIIAETLRIFPPATRLERECKETYTSDSGVVIPKDATACIPVYVIHHSEEYYPDPQEFKPERFSPEEKANRNPFTYLPFGYGPRNCIGMRLALMEMKLILANMVLKFKLKTCPQTEPYPPKLSVEGLLKPENPIWLKVESR